MTVKAKVIIKLLIPIVIEIINAVSGLILNKLYPCIIVISLTSQPPKLIGNDKIAVVKGPINKLYKNSILFSK
jgi:hypothetical protein